MSSLVSLITSESKDNPVYVCVHMIVHWVYACMSVCLAHLLLLLQLLPGCDILLLLNVQIQAETRRMISGAISVG